MGVGQWGRTIRGITNQRVKMIRHRSRREGKRKTRNMKEQMQEMQRSIESLVRGAHVCILIIVFARHALSRTLPVRVMVLRHWGGCSRGWSSGSVQSAHTVSVVVSQNWGWEGGADRSETALRISTKHIIRRHDVRRHRLYWHHCTGRGLGESGWHWRSGHLIRGRGEQELATIISTLAHHLRH